jgi:hypothetical protein
MHIKKLDRRVSKGIDRGRDLLFSYFYDLLASISNVKWLMCKQSINLLTNN